MSPQKGSPRVTPRGKGPLSPRASSSLWYGLAFLLLILLAQMYFGAPAGRSIPYSDFKTLLKNDQIVDVTISDQSIRGTLKQPVQGDPKGSKEFTVTRVDDPKLTEELEAKGVKYTGEVANRWLPDLLSWILPLVVLMGIW